MAISIEFGLSLNNVCNVICDDKNSQFFVKYCRFEFKNVIALHKTHLCGDVARQKINNLRN